MKVERDISKRVGFKAKWVLVLRFKTLTLLNSNF
nr:MAG TPA: hypothetical protein [Microviridae sp.]